ncbi:DUF1893 domain-containing protein [Thermotoga petrophila]|jgi:hypothetical protein|uniref:DUF1893 domain-containing protein n=1 Tax=Thermotoga petrophila TaxID=93929 RepID=UPI002FE2E83F|nr:hypothetical protein [Thermotoga sp.]
MEETLLKTALKIFEEKNLSLLVYNGRSIFESKDSGLKPVIELYQSFDNLEGNLVIDKMVGKVAASFLLKLKPEHIHAKVISEQALKLLNEYGQSFSYDEKIPFVLGRDGKSMCPFEKLVLEMDNPEEIIRIVLSKFTSL